MSERLTKRQTMAALAFRLGAVMAISLAACGHGMALSELQSETAPQAPAQPQVDPAQRVPLPSTTPPAAEDDASPPPEEDGLPVPARPDAESEAPVDTPSQGNAISSPEPNPPAPEVIYDLGRLPEPVRRMHGLILDAAKTGDINQLRPLIGTQDGGTQVSLTGAEDDPITYLTNLSGDPEGHEILAILDEVLEAGFVHLDAGTDEEMYVWPYFFAVPLDGLTPRQRVEMFRIVTAGDYEEMKSYGTYIFYRVGITPEGRWAFFLAGE